MKDNCKTLDKAGAVTSLACAVHCAIMPLVITFLPLIGLGWIANQSVEWLLFGMSAIIGASSLCQGYRKHRSRSALRVLAVGLSILALGRYGDAHHWAPYYVALLVVGGCTVAFSHFCNHRLCQSCHDCASHNEA